MLDELRGWKELPGMSDDAIRKLWLMRKAADEIDFRAARITELEAALQEARLQLEYLGEKFGQTGTGNAVLARINMALAGSATYERELEPPGCPTPGACSCR